MSNFYYGVLLYNGEMIWAIAVFAFGLAVGSFLNSIIFRMEQGNSVLVGHSACPQCNHPLAWQDLIPLLSFLTLRGKCRYCKKSISLQYPFVEFATGLVFLLIFWHLSLGLDWSLVIGHWSLAHVVYLWVITSLLVVIFVYDLKHYIIPDRFIYPAIVLALLYRALNLENLDLFRLPAGEAGTSDFGFGILPALFFLSIFIFSKGRWMGLGDFKLAVFMGLFLGWPNILVGLFSAFFLGALVGIFLVVSRKKEWKSQVPFGPFLITGTFVALFFGRALTEWYLNLVLI